MIAVLEEIIQSMAQEAIRHPPTLDQMVRHDSNSALRYTRKTKGSPPVSLTEAWEKVDLFRDFATQALIPENDLAPFNYRTPEQLLSALRTIGLSPVQNMGTIGSIEDLREHLETVPLRNMDILVNENIWIDNRNPVTYRIGPIRHSTRGRGDTKTMLHPTGNRTIYLANTSNS